MSATGTNITDLHELGKHDKETSDDLQRRIEDLKQTLESGHKPETAATLGAMETEGKKILKDLTRRIEEIEGRGNLDATDREMLRLLTVRQVVIDKQVMQLAELRDLIHVSHGINWYENKRLAGSGNILQRHEKPRLLKKWAKQDAEQASEPSTEAVPATEASPGEPLTTDPTNAHSPGCGLEVVAEHIQHGDDDETGDQEAVHESEEEFEQVFDDYNRPVYGVRYDDEDEDEDEEEEEPEPEVDKSDWPLCYRILDIDPATDKSSFEDKCKKQLRSLSLKHDPKRLPNDPDAPARWTAITKAYDTLVDPQRKQFYDSHGQTPALLKDFDLSTLHISE